MVARVRLQPAAKLVVGRLIPVDDVATVTTTRLGSNDGGPQLRTLHSGSSELKALLSDSVLATRVIFEFDAQTSSSGTSGRQPAHGVYTAATAGGLLRPGVGIDVVCSGVGDEKDFANFSVTLSNPSADAAREFWHKRFLSALQHRTQLLRGPYVPRAAGAFVDDEAHHDPDEALSAALPWAVRWLNGTIDATPGLFVDIDAVAPRKFVARHMTGDDAHLQRWYPATSHAIMPHLVTFCQQLERPKIRLDVAPPSETHSNDFGGLAAIRGCLRVACIHLREQLANYAFGRAQQFTTTWAPDTCEPLLVRDGLPDAINRVEFLDATFSFASKTSPAKANDARHPPFTLVGLWARRLYGEENIKVTTISSAVSSPTAAAQQQQEHPHQQRGPDFAYPLPDPTAMQHVRSVAECLPARHYHVLCATFHCGADHSAADIKTFAGMATKHLQLIVAKAAPDSTLLVTFSGGFLAGGVARFMLGKSAFFRHIRVVRTIEPGIEAHRAVDTPVAASAPLAAVTYVLHVE